MVSNNSTDRSFAINDCALAAIATGKKAQNLRELRDALLTINPESIYYHFWGWRLRQRFEVAEFNNDFATWAHLGLRDNRLAERLSVIDPTEFEDLEALRRELVDEIEERLDEGEHVPWSKNDNQFYFIRSQIVVFSTLKEISHPEELPAAISHLTVGSIFYHFIDARRRTPDGIDDFSAWLQGFNGQYKDLCARIATIDPYFHTLIELRQQLAREITRHFMEAK